MRNREELKQKLHGCYITIPTLFNDPDLSINEGGIRTHIQFLKNNNINKDNSVFLSGGAAGDFSTMTIEERLKVASIVIDEAGDIPVTVGAQSTNTTEIKIISKRAADLGASFIQVSCPFYFNHTEEDFYEYIVEASKASDIGIIIYNTFWTSAEVSFNLIERLIEIPQVVGLKWAAPRSSFMPFEDVVHTFSNKFCFIDNDLLFPISYVLGARAFEVHLCNHWPQWGVKLLNNLYNNKLDQVVIDMANEAKPFYKLWSKIENEYTSGDGYLDKLCMELVGLPSSRCRPPTRDIRNIYREQARKMLIESGTPGVI